MNERSTGSNYRVCIICKFRWPIEQMTVVKQVLDIDQYVCEIAIKTNGKCNTES